MTTVPLFNNQGQPHDAAAMARESALVLAAGSGFPQRYNGNALTPGPRAALYALFLQQASQMTVFMRTFSRPAGPVLADGSQCHERLPGPWPLFNGHVTYLHARTGLPYVVRHLVGGLPFAMELMRHTFLVSAMRRT